MRCSTSRAWLANEIATEFARAEGIAFVKGTGTNQPLGFSEFAERGDRGRGAAAGHAAVHRHRRFGGFPGEQSAGQVGPGPRKGPRLGDLTVQTSSYGNLVPRIYGTMRVAGTVVWATDLKEDREK